MKKIILATLLVSVLALCVILSGCEKKPADTRPEDIQSEDIQSEGLFDNEGPIVSDPDAGEDLDLSDIPEITGTAVNTEVSEYEYTTAEMLIDHPVDELLELIGEPNDRSYASSCIGSGEDGELYYTGFTVVTYLENGTETVVDVYKD